MFIRESLENSRVMNACSPGITGRAAHFCLGGMGGYLMMIKTLTRKKEMKL